MPDGERKRLKRTRAYRVSAERLRALRTGRGWSQQEAANYGGVSDRLIRKAETGKPIELKSVALLAALYSMPDERLKTEDLLAEPAELSGVPEILPREALFHRWLEAAWHADRLATIDRILSRDCRFHAGGKLYRGPANIRRQLAARLAARGDCAVQLEQLLIDSEWVAGRWRLTLKPGGRVTSAAARRRAVTHGSTWIRVADSLCVELWEFWTPPA